MDTIKKKSLNIALDSFNKIYIHAAPHKDLVIGRRGLIGNEKTLGILLAISASSCKSFNMESDGIFAELRFSGRWEQVFIPYEAVDGILDDLNSPTFVFNFPLSQQINDNAPKIKPEAEYKHKSEDKTKEKNEGKHLATILRPDFSKGKDKL